MVEAGEYIEQLIKGVANELFIGAQRDCIVGAESASAYIVSDCTRSPAFVVIAPPRPVQHAHSGAGKMVSIKLVDAQARSFG